jgi:hypothetical protein
MPAATLARFVVLETLRSGLPWLAGASIVVAVALAAFLSGVALTETRALQLSIVAALLRAAAIFLVAAHVSAATLRELNDKGLELMLALPLARSTHYLGRLAGHALCAGALALAFAAPLLLWAPAGAVAHWGVSLACEAALVAAAALFFSMTLAQPVPAMAATLALYLLARTIDAIQAIAAGPLVETSLAAQAQRLAVEGIALALPRLDAVTRSEWLLYGTPPAGAFFAALAGLGLYAALLTAAGLFDFQRRTL